MKTGVFNSSFLGKSICILAAFFVGNPLAADQAQGNAQQDAIQNNTQQEKSWLTASNNLSSYAEEDEDSDSEAEEDERTTTILGKRVIRRDRTNSIEPTLSYDIDFFQRFEPNTLQDMLKRVPGVHFDRLVKTEVNSSIFEQRVKFRGIADRGGQILINGRRIPGITDGNNVDLATISADRVKEIQVIRSPTPDIDSQGTGLTINVILKDGSDIPVDSNVNWRVSGGSNDGKAGGTVAVDATGAISENVRYSAGVSHSDRPIKAKTTTVTFINGLFDPFDPNSYFEEVTSSIANVLVDEAITSFNGTLSIELDESSLEVSARYAFQEAESEGFESTESVTIFFDGIGGNPIGTQTSRDSFATSSGQSEIETVGIAANYQSFFGEDNSWKLDFSFDTSDYRGIQEGGSYRAKDREEIKLGGEIDFALTESQRFKIGIDLAKADDQDDTFNAADTSTFIPTPALFTFADIEEEALDLFFIYSVTLSESVDFFIGSRYESTDYDLTTRFDGSIERANLFAGIDILSSSLEGVKYENSANNPSTTLRWKITDNQQLRLSLARTVNLPSVNDVAPLFMFFENDGFTEPTLAGQYAAFVGSPFIEPEKSNGIDLSYDYDFDNGNGNGILGISLFYKETKDQLFDFRTRNRSAIEEILPIVADLEAVLGSTIYEVSINVNGDATLRSKGAEVDFSIPMDLMGIPNMNFLSNISYYEAEGISRADINQKQERTSANFTIDHSIISWGLTYGISYSIASDDEVRAIKDVNVDDAINDEIDDRDASVDIFIEKRFTDTLLVRFNVENVTDAKFREIRRGSNTVDDFFDTNTRTFESDPIYSLTVRGSF